jgi:hypothetical protein
VAEIFAKNFISLIRAVGVDQAGKLRLHIRTIIHRHIVEDKLVR